MLIIWSEIKVSIKNKNRIICLKFVRSHNFNVHLISKLFCISRTGKSYGQMFTPSNFPFDFNTIFNLFDCSHQTVRWKQDTNRFWNDVSIQLSNFYWKCIERKTGQKIISCDHTFNFNTILGSFVHLHNFYPKLFIFIIHVKNNFDATYFFFKNPAWKYIAF